MIDDNMKVVKCNFHAWSMQERRGIREDDGLQINTHAAINFRKEGHSNWFQLRPILITQRFEIKYNMIFCCW